MKRNQSLAILVIAASSITFGCASQDYQPTYQPGYSSSAPSSYRAFGVIDSIQVINDGGGSSSGAGAVIGGIAGGILGNQVGGGSGNTAATIAGAVGGAVVGNQIERNRAQPRTTYQISVRLDNGQYQTINQDNVEGLRVGNRVEIQNDRVYRY